LTSPPPFLLPPTHHSEISRNPNIVREVLKFNAEKEKANIAAGQTHDEESDDDFDAEEGGGVSE